VKRRRSQDGNHPIPRAFMEEPVNPLVVVYFPTDFDYVAPLTRFY
jgi:hypothetical protein